MTDQAIDLNAAEVCGNGLWRRDEVLVRLLQWAQPNRQFAFEERLMRLVLFALLKLSLPKAGKPGRDRVSCVTPRFMGKHNRTYQ